MSQEWSVKEIIAIFRKTANTDRDNLAAIDGRTGTGKSTLALKLCIRGCPWFNMERDILYSRAEILEWITNAKKGSWGLADEAVNALFKRDFATREQKFLLKLFDMCRDKNLTLFFCIPNFWGLDKHLLDGRIRLRIHVTQTGLAHLWRPTGNPFTPDPWCRKYNEKICRNWDYQVNPRKTKGYVGFIKFGDLTDKTKNQYLTIKKEKKEMIQRQEEEEEKNRELKRDIFFDKPRILAMIKNRGVLNDRQYKELLNEESELMNLKPSVLVSRVKRAEESLKMQEGTLFKGNKKSITLGDNQPDSKRGPNSFVKVQYGE